MGQRMSATARVKRGPWKQDVTPDRFTAHPGRDGTVGRGRYCVARTEVTKHTNVGRNEITVAPGRTVGGHIYITILVRLWPSKSLTPSNFFHNSNTEI